MLELEDQKERVRILLARYGLLTREIANREGGLFRWAALFNALRVMELSGEVLAGLFVKDMSGPSLLIETYCPNSTKLVTIEQFGLVRWTRFLPAVWD